MSCAGVLGVVVEVFSISMAQHLFEPLLPSKPLEESFNHAQGGINGGKAKRLTSVWVLCAGKRVFELARLFDMEFAKGLIFGAFLELDQRGGHLIQRRVILPFGLFQKDDVIAL